MRFRRAAALAVGLTSVATPAGAQTHDRVERAVVRKLNAIRAQSGVRRLHASRGLARAADVQSGAVAGGGAFAHGDVRSRVLRFVRAAQIGEAMAWVPASSGSNADAVVGVWMASASHRATLLSGRFSRIGVGRRRAMVGGQQSVVFTVDLASAR